MKRFAIVALVAVFSGPGLAAEECTEADAEKLSNEVFAMVEKEPAIAEKLDGYIKEIENEYGGEPSPEQTCDALRKLMAMVKAGD